MSRIEIGRYSQMLRRVLGMKGVVEVAGELSPEISPTWMLEQPGPEWNFLKDVRDCAGASVITGGVGFTSKFRLRNPAGSGVIAVVEAIYMLSRTGTDGLVAVNQQTVNFPVADLTVAIDGRWNPGSTLAQSALIFTNSITQAGAPAGDEIARPRLPVDVEFRYEREIVLVPGNNMDFGTIGTNLTLHAHLRWRERGIPALEL